MTPRNSPIAEPAERVLVITRVFDAPRSLVFKVWTQPEHLVRWWGPRGFTTPSCKMDVRAGGAYRTCIRSPEGKDYWMRGVYREIVEPDRLVFTFAWEVEEGQPGHETLVTVTFRRTRREDETHLPASDLRVGCGARFASGGLDRMPGSPRGLPGKGLSPRCLGVAGRRRCGARSQTLEEYLLSGN
jgi:uncharacterized protein YndB with AHSA1/START domain